MNHPCDLPKRERDILQLIGEEVNTKTIAIMLKLSPKTVEFHRANLMRRTGIYNQIGLAKLALRLGLITL